MFRFLFLIIAAIGIVLAVIYPFVVQNFGGYELERHQVYSGANGFSAVEVTLTSEEAPVRVLVDYVSSTQVNAVMASAALAMTVLRNGEKAIEQTLEFVHSSPGENSVQSGSFSYRASGGVIHPVGTETFSFAFTPVGETTLKPDSVELILMASAIEWEPRAQLLGYVMMALGFIGFVIATVGKGKKTEIHNPQKWGRGGDPDS